MEVEWEMTPADVVTPTDTEPTFSANLSSESMALNAFELFVTDEVVNHIVHHTNLYATQERTRGWITLTAEELKAYFGMLILMSANPMHQVHLYSSSDSLFYVKEIVAVMTHKRFQQITNNLHLNDNTQMPKKGSKEYDRCFKVRPLIEMNENFRKEYTPSSRLAVDESMILFKGRSSMKQYMPMKPKIKRGYKVWCIADSSTGYLCKFEIYQGKQHERPNNRTLGEHVVLSLAEGIVTPGTQLFFDNLFSSTALLQQLRDKGILACGTFRTNRKDLPAKLKVNNKLDHGEFIWRRKNNVTAYQWRDTKHVHIMSNYQDPCEDVRVDRTTPKGHKKAVRCPEAVRDYNRWMGRVDRFDQKKMHIH
ncbi:hypothetical protein MTO96_035698 [Rhipicephalus appendiculatus]